MKILSIALLLSVGMAGAAEAFEVRAGMSNVQVRDRAYDGMAGNVDEVFDLGPWSFFKGFQVQGAFEFRNDTDILGGLRYGVENGRLNGVSTRLMLLEPGAGIRRRFALQNGFVLHGQAMLAFQYMEAAFAGPGKDSYHRAVFATVTPSIGATYFPRLQRKRNLGFGIDLGYATPAPLRFQERGDVAPGTLNYGGITYGLFAVYRLDAGGEDGAFGGEERGRNQVTE
jgi:hypothetical protein